MVQTVVSGESDPDTFTLSKSWNNCIQILDKYKGTKNKVLKMADNGLEEVTDIGENWSLTDEQVLYLGKIGVVLEEAFGNARDIEWAYYNVSYSLLIFLF